MAVFCYTDEENLKDLEILLKDTERICVSSADEYTSGEIREENIILAKKNIKEIGKLLGEIKNKTRVLPQELSARVKTAEKLLDKLQQDVGEICLKFLGGDISDLSSFDGFYGHLSSSLESVTLSDLSDPYRIPTWVASDKKDEWLARALKANKPEVKERWKFRHQKESWRLLILTILSAHLSKRFAQRRLYKRKFNRRQIISIE